MAEENLRRRQVLPVGDGDWDDSATEVVYLDEDELFSQLCTVTNLVKPGPKSGLFLSHVNVSDGVLRVWRHRLAEMAGQVSGSEPTSTEDQVLWVDAAQNIGLRFSVTPGPAERMPVLSGPDDLPPVSYRLKYEGMLDLLNYLFHRLC